MSVSDNKKNCGTHRDSSFMLGRLRPSSENPPDLSVGSVNCGRTLSYDDGSPCRKCRRYGADNDPTQWIPIPVSWGDKIRSMNDEELGQFLVSFSMSVDYPYSSARSAMLRGEILQWLKQEVKL